jgi:hypothetical protein
VFEWFPHETTWQEWSANRHALRFVGTEEGILEYAVNLDDRKTFPGMAFR